VEIVRAILIGTEIIFSVLLIGLVLLQKSKGGGLGVSFGGGGGEALFGSRTGNVLTKGTIILGSAFLVNTIALAVLFSGASGGESLMERAIREEPPPPRVEPLPGVEPFEPLPGAGEADAPAAVPTDLPAGPEAELEPEPVAPAEPRDGAAEPEPAAP
jgi:preprotein translocase subunit SecG